jgi:hypothetical protein
MVANEKLFTVMRSRMFFLHDEMGVSSLGRTVYIDSKQVCKGTVEKHDAILYS